jgi:hypothetical protein
MKMSDQYGMDIDTIGLACLGYLARQYLAVWLDIYMEVYLLCILIEQAD